MFAHTDPYAQLDLHRQRVAELARQASDDRLAREATGRHRFGRRRPSSYRPAAA